MLEFLDIIHLFCTELRRLKIGGFCKLNSNPAKATEERSLSICQSSADDNQPSRTLEHLCIAIPDHLDFESQASSYLLDLIPRRYRYSTTLEIHDINWIKRDVHDEKYLVTKLQAILSACTQLRTICFTRLHGDYFEQLARLFCTVDSLKEFELQNTADIEDTRILDLPMLCKELIDEIRSKSIYFYSTWVEDDMRIKEFRSVTIKQNLAEATYAYELRNFGFLSR